MGTVNLDAHRRPTDRDGRMQGHTPNRGMARLTPAQRADVHARLDELVDEVRDLSRRLDGAVSALDAARFVASPRQRAAPGR